jgi:N-acetylglucosaminyl-diphospho-decaprenol L-rhamnosyltransferase
VESPNAPPVAVAVVSWNTRELLRRCLLSLEPEIEAGRAEAWVVDNGSTDGSVELVRDEFPRARLLVPGENLGFGPAVNRVAERTASAWIAPANADIELTPGALEALLEAGAADPGAGAVAPKLLLPDGSVQPSIQPFPELWSTLLKHLRVYHLSHRLGEHLCLKGYWNPDQSQRVAWATGAFLIVRREAYERIGGFDDDQWMYAEDLDLCWRLKREGWTTRFEPRAVVHHALSVAAAQAFGDWDARAPRVSAATYSWLARRRGVVVAWLMACLNLSAAAFEVAVLHRLWPSRASPRARSGLRLHRLGLRSRKAPLRMERAGGSGA